jgi:hypothetical protein
MGFRLLKSCENTLKKATLNVRTYTNDDAFIKITPRFSKCLNLVGRTEDIYLDTLSQIFVLFVS